MKYSKVLKGANLVDVASLTHGYHLYTSDLHAVSFIFASSYIFIVSTDVFTSETQNFITARVINRCHDLQVVGFMSFYCFTKMD